MTPEPTFTIRQLSDHVGRPVRSIRNAIAKGLLDYHQESDGGTIYLTLEGWEAYLEKTLSNAKSNVKTSTPAIRRRAAGRRGRGQAVKARRDPTAYADIDF